MATEVRQGTESSETTGNVKRNLPLEYATLDREIKAAEAKAKRLRAQKDALEELVKDEFIERGIDNIRVTGFDASPIRDALSPQGMVTLELLASLTDGLSRVGIGDDAITEAIDALQTIKDGDEAARSTIYIDTRIWALAARDDDGNPDNERTLAALRAYPETAELIKETWNTHTLSSWARELPRDDNGDIVLPDELRDAIHIDERQQVKVRKA